MWRSICQSVPGRRHLIDDARCQDYGLARFAGDAARGALVACVSDGAGTAALGGHGARVACESLVKLAGEHFEATRTRATVQASDVIEWCREARRIIEDAARHRQQPLRDYASTLCGAVIAARRSVFFQIGDGAIVARRHGAIGVVFWPQSGEYLNTTSFLTSDDYLARLQVCVIEGGFADVALFTDGVERLALQFDAQTPHLPFFLPLFAGVRAASDVDSLNGRLRQFLTSESVAAKNDDDKTLLLACRIADEVRHVA